MQVLQLCPVWMHTLHTLPLLNPCVTLSIPASISLPLPLLTLGGVLQSTHTVLNIYPERNRPCNSHPLMKAEETGSESHKHRNAYKESRHFGIFKCTYRPYSHDVEQKYVDTQDLIPPLPQILMMNEPRNLGYFIAQFYHRLRCKNGCPRLRPFDIF